MSEVKTIDWMWDHGKSFTKITYSDGEVDSRQNLEPPPTRAAHDIAHFICAFHKNLEWDYISYTPHIAEYNAVFVEGLLGSFSHLYYNDQEIDIESSSDTIFTKMKWFAQDYYKIHIDHPSRKNYLELKNQFFENVDLDILVQHFNPFYQTFIIERLVDSKDFNLSVKMDSSDRYDFEPLQTYLNKVSKILIDRDN